MTDNQGGEAATVEADVEAAAQAALSSQDDDKGGSDGRDYEAEAREQGWRPKEEWSGKPDNWKDAKTYVEFGDTTKRLSKIEERVEKEVAARVSRIEKVSAAAIERLTKINEEKIASLMQGRREAVKTGNVELVEKYDTAIENQKADAPDKDAPDDVNTSFKKRNDWFQVDEDLTALAVGKSQAILQAYFDEHGKPMQSEKMYEAVEKAVKSSSLYKAKYPDTAAANGHAAVDGGGESSAPAKKGKTAADIPAADRAIGMQFVKAGAFPNIEAYAKEYFNA